MDWENRTRAPFSSAPPSASCSENPVIPHNVSGRTLRYHRLEFERLSGNFGLETFILGLEFYFEKNFFFWR
jgi:hypothetical protein